MINKINLPYSLDALEPYYSKETLLIHYETLYSGYVDNTNKTQEKLEKESNNEEESSENINLENFTIGQNVEEKEPDYSNYEVEEPQEEQNEDYKDDETNYPEYVKKIKKEKHKKQKFDKDMEDY